MATVAATITDVSSVGMPGSAYLVTWTPLTQTNADGAAVTLPAWTDRSVQIVGTFGTATVVLEGSNDGTNWATLTDPQGNAISTTSAKLEQVEEATRYFRANSSGGNGATSVSVYVFCTGYRVR